MAQVVFFRTEIILQEGTEGKELLGDARRPAVTVYGGPRGPCVVQPKRFVFEQRCMQRAVMHDVSGEWFLGESKSRALWTERLNWIFFR